MWTRVSHCDNYQMIRRTRRRRQTSPALSWTNTTNVLNQEALKYGTSNWSFCQQERTLLLPVPRLKLTGRVTLRTRPTCQIFSQPFTFGSLNVKLALLSDSTLNYLNCFLCSLRFSIPNCMWLHGNGSKHLWPPCTPCIASETVISPLSANHFDSKRPQKEYILFSYVTCPVRNGVLIATL